jgi:hypothetical protein
VALLRPAQFLGLRAIATQPMVPINALRDAYHIREWIWHDRLEHDAALQAVVMGAAGTEESWNGWVNQQFPDFPVIRELCNGSKHFESRGRARAFLD